MKERSKRQLQYERLFHKFRDMQIKQGSSIADKQVKVEIRTVNSIFNNSSSIESAKSAIRKYYNTKAKKQWQQVYANIWDVSSKATIGFITDYYSAGKTFSIVTYRAAGPKDDPIQAKVDAYTIDYLKNKGRERVVSLNDTTSKRVLNYIDGLIAQEESQKSVTKASLGEMANNVKGFLTDLWVKRIEPVIATEIVPITGGVIMLALSILKKDMLKVWMTMGDDNVRPAHQEAELDYADGIPLDEPYVVDGEYLWYPGDPSGSDGNVINCRCWEEHIRGD